jgi:hypothetical protein
MTFWVCSFGVVNCQVCSRSDHQAVTTADLRRQFERTGYLCYEVTDTAGQTESLRLSADADLRRDADAAWVHAQLFAADAEAEVCPERVKESAWGAEAASLFARIGDPTTRAPGRQLERGGPAARLVKPEPALSEPAGEIEHVMVGAQAQANGASVAQVTYRSASASVEAIPRPRPAAPRVVPPPVTIRPSSYASGPRQGRLL